MLRSLFVASVLFSAGLVGGCSDTTAYADQVAAPQPGGPQIALGVSPAKIRAPYDVQIIRENGEMLATYAQKDRFYVQGNAGERYTIRVTNPTAHRIEAVVSVDGVDVIDGEAGDIRKRGYVVPAYGETRIEGFRTSTADVATFRFSSVDDSYAGKKGVARNVGVIAVALFEEQALVEEQQIIVGDGDDSNGHYRRPATGGKYDYTDDLDGAHGTADPARQAPRYRPPSADTKSDRGGDKDEGRVAAKKKAPSYRPPADEPARAPAPTTATARPSAPPPPTGGYGGAVRDRSADAEDYRPAETAPAQRTERPGLGTEFGESRYSAASYTRFVRAPGRPIAVAELRYNDAPGLEALGINVRPRPDSGEIMSRETADPFPGDSRFSRPPGE